MENITIRQGDWKDLIKDIPDCSVDCVITDPPYNCLALDWDNQEIDWQELTKELFRVLKDFGSIYIFGQMPMINNVYNAFTKRFTFRQDLVWVKNRGISLAKTVFMRKHENILYFIKDDSNKWVEFGKHIKNRRLELGYSLKQMGELCQEKWYHRGGHLYYETGLGRPTKEQYDKLKEVLKLDNGFDDTLFNNQTFNFDDIKVEGKPYKTHRKNQKLYGQISKMVDYVQDNNGYRHPPSVLNYDIIQTGSEYIGHPTQKPIKLIRYLIKASTNENDLVLDCFAGSGTILVACQELNRRGVGFEIKEEYVTLTNTRINQKNIHHFSNTLLSQPSAEGSLISVKRESADSQNSPHDSSTIKEEANFS